MLGLYFDTLIIGQNIGSMFSIVHNFIAKGIAKFHDK